MLNPLFPFRYNLSLKYFQLLSSPLRLLPLFIFLFLNLLVGMFYYYLLFLWVFIMSRLCINNFRSSPCSSNSRSTTSDDSSQPGGEGAATLAQLVALATTAPLAALATLLGTNEKASPNIMKSQASYRWRRLKQQLTKNNVRSHKNRARNDIFGLKLQPPISDG